MIWKNDKIIWSPRLKKDKLHLLYKQESIGLIDNDLLEDVGITLYLRCKDIKYIYDAHMGDFRCPRCEFDNPIQMTLSDGSEKHKKDYVYTCPSCSFNLTWEEFRQLYRKKQLNPGGAISFFMEYISSWENAKTEKQKMLAIDKVIHSFHYSLKSQPDLPTRAAGVNLIEGRLSDIIVFLDDITYGKQNDISDTWFKERNRMQELHKSWRD